MHGKKWNKLRIFICGLSKDKPLSLSCAFVPFSHQPNTGAVLMPLKEIEFLLQLIFLERIFLDHPHFG